MVVSPTTMSCLDSSSFFFLLLNSDYKLQVFWPSSIGAFGPTTPSENTPQHTILEPNTYFLLFLFFLLLCCLGLFFLYQMISIPFPDSHLFFLIHLDCSMYGVTKVSGELLCNYYHQRFGVDVRSLRYPGESSFECFLHFPFPLSLHPVYIYIKKKINQKGIISWKAEPGGGTTDYAVAIFYGALKKDHRYECYLRPDSMVTPTSKMDSPGEGERERPDVFFASLLTACLFSLCTQHSCP